MEVNSLVSPENCCVFFVDIRSSNMTFIRACVDIYQFTGGGVLLEVQRQNTALRCTCGRGRVAVVGYTLYVSVTLLWICSRGY